MKQIYVLACVVLSTTFGTLRAQDYAPGTLNFDYDFQTATISNISFELKNLDDFPTFEVVDVNFFLVDIGTGSNLIGTAYSDEFGLDAKSQETLTISDVDVDQIPGLVTGLYYIKVVIDSGDAEEETNETNNSKTYTSQPIEFEALPAGISLLTKSNEIATAYPNPVIGNEFQVEIAQLSSNYQFNLYSVQGTQVNSTTQIIAANRLSIEVASLPTGIYFYSILNNGTVYKGNIVRK